ncbi:hypothetical protein O1611_g4494 [Lasiodiplodia mahajangana]|uniref:Uncharacterized protein n=1 Tax=Lasiodiplodia mahajangana TaxID=1108764 RepID=A0ACC2JNR5_9PEZI|nr:hypothetical protein O1611_g4494 [Lasiodiplodia mahajangana]
MQTWLSRMPNSRSHYRSRSSRHHVHGPQHPRRHRRHRHEYEYAPHVAEDDRSPDGDIADDNVDAQLSGWVNPSWVEGDPDVSYTNSSVYSTRPPSDRMMVASDETLDGSQYDFHRTSGDPTWDEQQGFYHHSPHDWTQNSMPPATSSQMEASLDLLETAFDQEAPTPSWEYQPGQAWAVSAPQDQIAEADMSNRIRRMSTRARQGSAVFPNEGYNAVAASSINQPDGVGDHDSSDSSGGTSPVNREEYVHGFVNGEDVPWSSERAPRRWPY